MEEKNPLDFHISEPIPKRSLQNNNKRGRPPLEKVIKFSPQPKSIISQLLNKTREKNYNCKNEEMILKVTSDVSYTESVLEKDVSHQINLESEIELKSQKECSSFQRGSNFDLTCPEDSHDSLKDNYVSHENEQELHQNQSLLLGKIPTTESEVPEISCYVCSHRSNSHKTHKAHMSTHRNQPYVCNFPKCKYSSKLSSNLIKHKRIHTSEKPYLCDQCTFRSNFGNSLKVHKRIHTSERPFGCQYCSYRCNSSSNLKKHCLHRHPAVS